jgi:adenylate cyclase class 2
MSELYEVELKFPLLNRAVVESFLGKTLSFETEQTDIYFDHPSRDFVQTDETFRLRYEKSIDSIYPQELNSLAITWKGPRIDQEVSKTRREIGLPISYSCNTQTLEAWSELLVILGFRRIIAITKQRLSAVVNWRGSQIEMAIDKVAGLGDFLELEAIAMKDGIQNALATVKSLATELGCGNMERRSYLELFLQNEKGGNNENSNNDRS